MTNAGVQRWIADSKQAQRERDAHHIMTLTPSEKVLILRRRMKMTQDEFGKLLGVTGKTVQFWELGRTPRGRVLDKLEILEQRWMDGK